MSIATLKKKTQTKYNNMSAGERQFSINGTRRSQGYVGQDTLGRSLPRTLMRGNVIRGHGGCCGKYPIQPIIQSSVTSTNNPNVVKSSVLGTSGMISTKYAWIERPQPYTRVKPDNNQNNNSQSDYITYVVDKTLNDTEYALSDTLLVYPPLSPVTTFGTTILSNLSYGNGSYITTATGITAYFGNGPFYNSVELTTANRWQTGGVYTVSSTYNGNTIYSLPANTNITNVSGVSYNGHWLQIEFPYKIKLNRYHITPRVGVTVNIIQNLIVAGSNDNTNWTFLSEMKLSSSPKINERLYFNVNDNIGFKQYRIIKISGFSIAPSLFDFQFYSYDKYYCQGEANYTSVTSCKKNTCTTNKPGINYNYAIPSGEYIRRLINCRTKDNHFYVASRNNKQPFTGFN